MSAKTPYVVSSITRNHLHFMQEQSNNYARMLTDAISGAWPVGLEVKVKLRADQINPTLGKVQSHWGSSVIVKLTNTKKQRVKYVHWHNVISP